MWPIGRALGRGPGGSASDSRHSDSGARSRDDSVASLGGVISEADETTTEEVAVKGDPEPTECRVVVARLLWEQEIRCSIHRIPTLRE